MGCRCNTACYSFRVDDEKDESGQAQADAAPRKKVRKERVLHTRVPAVLDQELKRLATNLRVPVSNVVRAILEDAIDAVDSVGEKAQGELLGFVDRIARQRGELRQRKVRAPEAANEPTMAPVAPVEPSGASEAASTLEGVLGFQAFELAAATHCGACGTPLARGQEASRAIFVDPARHLLVCTACRKLGEKQNDE